MYTSCIFLYMSWGNWPCSDLNLALYPVCRALQGIGLVKLWRPSPRQMLAAPGIDGWGIVCHNAECLMFPAGQSYDETVDIFSFGIVLCEVSPGHYVASSVDFSIAISFHTLYQTVPCGWVCSLWQRSELGRGYKAYPASILCQVLIEPWYPFCWKRCSPKLWFIYSYCLNKRTVSCIISVNSGPPLWMAYVFKEEETETFLQVN